MTFAPFLAGIAFGLFIAGLIALAVWHFRNPMTPEEEQTVEEERNIW